MQRQQYLKKIQVLRQQHGGVTPVYQGQEPPNENTFGSFVGKAVDGITDFVSNAYNSITSGNAGTQLSLTIEQLKLKYAQLADKFYASGDTDALKILSDMWDETLKTIDNAPKVAEEAKQPILKDGGKISYVGKINNKVYLLDEHKQVKRTIELGNGINEQQYQLLPAIISDAKSYANIINKL